MKSFVTDLVLILSSSIGLSILVKATVIMLVGLVAGALAGRARASWRHLVFATTFAGVLALPLIVLAAPEMPIEVVTAQSEDVKRSSIAPTSSTTMTTPATIVTALPSASTSFAWSVPSIPTLLLFVWGAGAFFLMLSLIIDLLRVRHLRRHGLPSKRLRDFVALLTVDGTRRPVDVMLHENIQAPVTFGFLRPVIMLPRDAESWNEADLRRALVHELEHIRRADWATQLAARAGCAFYWFHPLIWMTWRNLCLEAERACDDAVVQTAEHTEYAEQLVSLSRQLTGTRSQPVLGMAKRSDLARRISSLLDTTRGRGRVSLAAAALSIFIGSLFVAAIGPMRAVAQVAPKPVAEKQIASANSKEDDDDDDERGRNRLDWALFRAAERNAIEKVAPLIEQGADVNALLQGDGTPLIAAAREGHVEMVRLLLDAGAKPNLGVSGDGNPLLNAAREGQREVVILLLDRGADINAGVEGDGNALIMASGSGHADIVTLLLDRGADIHKVVAGDENPIIKACEAGQLGIVKLLVARGADVNSRVRVDVGRGARSEEEYRTPLSMARRGGHTAIVEYLLSQGARQ